MPNKLWCHDKRKADQYRACKLPMIDVTVLTTLYSDACRLLEYGALDKKDIRVIVNGDCVPEDILSSDAAYLDNYSIVDLYSKGATLVINGVDRFFDEIKQLSRDLEVLLSQRVHANIYLTPRDANGVGYHTDNHDVLILQVSGTKEWLIRDNAQHENLCTTEIGGWHFIETGIEHTTRTVRDYSMHITFGLNSKQQLRLRDVSSLHIPEDRSSIESINATTDITRSDDFDLIVPENEIQRLVISYISNQDTGKSLEFLYAYFSKCTYSDIKSFVDMEGLSNQARVKFINLLSKSKVVHIYS